MSNHARNSLHVPSINMQVQSWSYSGPTKRSRSNFWIMQMAFSDGQLGTTLFTPEAMKNTVTPESPHARGRVRWL